MYHYLRVLPSISAFWTRKRQTLLLFAITLIKIWKQAKKRSFFSPFQDKFAFCLTKFRFALSLWCEDRSPLRHVTGSAALCPAAGCFLFEIAVLGSTKKTLSPSFCPTLDVSENNLSSPPVLPGWWAGGSFLWEFLLKTHSQDLFP